MSEYQNLSNKLPYDASTVYFKAGGKAKVLILPEITNVLMNLVLLIFTARSADRNDFGFISEPYAELRF